ncbi:MAG: glycoside hydrolase family 130 protein [Spirochaetes bacterium]|nr:glycoside hydrolase family 130 protein [Spirochaetota bacterium]
MSKLTSSSVIKRYANNPVLCDKDVPYPATLVFNAGITKYQGKYVMVFRNDYGNTQAEVDAGTKKPWELKTNIGLAFSDDGKKWKVEPKPCFDLSSPDGEIRRSYDPRLTVIDGRVYMCFAVDTNHGLRGGIAVTDDFKKFDVLHLTVPDNRNMVLFPEKIGGRYMRLERPFPVYSRGGKDRFDIWMSASPDMKYWGDSHLVLGVEDVPYANDKIGPAAPPIKTKKGWLTTFHAVDRDDATRGKNGWEPKWTKRYTGGIMLLDLNDPSKIVGMSKEPLIAPEAPYEASGGYRNDVIFPGGMVLEPDGEVKIYYGAADTVECLATAHVDDLIKLCTEAR